MLVVWSFPWQKRNSSGDRRACLDALPEVVGDHRGSESAQRGPFNCQIASPFGAVIAVRPRHQQLQNRPVARLDMRAALSAA